MIEFLSQPWPWYVAGPLFGIMVPILLLVGGKIFGVSGSLQLMCSVIPSKIEYFQTNWKAGAWKLALVFGIVVGGWIGTSLLENPNPIALSDATRTDLVALGVTDFSGLIPSQLFSWESLMGPGFFLLVMGGFLLGFGARYAGGCTSGHAISGLANLQLPSLIAVIGFFAGGLIAVHLLLPFIL